MAKTPFMNALGDLSEDESDEEEETKARPAVNLGKISYEALQVHGLRESSVMDVPDPHAVERERIAAAKEVASKAAKALEEDVPLIKNAFGKWQYQSTDPHHKRLMREAEAEDQPPLEEGPSAREMQEMRNRLRAAAMRQEADAAMAGAVKFDLASAGGAKNDKELEAEARRVIQQRQLQDSKKAAETTRQKNKRKQARGQANFTLKEGRDCPDIHHR
mmetsp:Transcript_38566/g.64896  ORF Transcript_38566/g.64896 Transcript_38566/m.64896 type:complete len:218 (+) Transcript_38566:152-805(+)|eukprot:CAMPEP_0198204144 /NCGR_PEP_ID=MMETSP1445-20131203/7525_1 /TAXON_ID=36898 /ORGANISM="Pyramimonas sp., Strain CCMP2087" /LENGTH=217 /DNA_ID=CAMNT_0043875885 /DNA_START=123 /DNA_END=776 /DNA_ORIENTATION=-